jgi:hypothetical protein
MKNEGLMRSRNVAVAAYGWFWQQAVKGGIRPPAIERMPEVLRCSHHRTALQ